MPYLQFDTDCGPVLVELGVQEIPSEPGVVKAGIADRVQDNVARAGEIFDQALGSLIRGNAGAFIRAVNSLTEAPDRVEIEFGIKATGEVGNLAISRLSGDVNYAVKLTWTQRGRGSDEDA